MIPMQGECYMLQGSRDKASRMKTVFIIAIQALFFPQLWTHLQPQQHNTSSSKVITELSLFKPQLGSGAAGEGFSSDPHQIACADG